METTATPFCSFFYQEVVSMSPALESGLVTCLDQQNMEEVMLGTFQSLGLKTPCSS